MKTTQDNIVHAQRTACEFSFLGFHHEDENMLCAIRTVCRVSHFSASVAGWAMALMGARESPEEGDGILQMGRSPHLGQDPTSRAGDPCPIPQLGKAESAADETRKDLAVSWCPPERVVNVQRGGVAADSTSRGPVWASQPGRRHFLGSLFNVASPHGNLGFQGFLHWWGETGPEVCVSRGCLAARVALEKLVETMEMDTSVKIWEAGLADEPLGMADLGGHLPPGIACASFPLLGCCYAQSPL